MRHQRALYQFLERRIKSLMEILAMPEKSFKVEQFHQLRVEVKKIHALFSLVEDCSNNFSRKKHFKSFKKIFKSAAAVRDCQVKQRLLLRFKLVVKNSRIIQALKKEEHKAKREFFEANKSSLNNKMKTVARNVSKRLRKIKTKKLERFKKNSMNAVFKLTVKRFMQEDLHETRMLLKERMYTLKTFLPKRNKFIPRLDDLQETIGKWHDYEVAGNEAMNFASDKKLGKREQKRLSNIRSKLVAGKLVVFRQAEKKRQLLAGSRMKIQKSLN